jgi:hypothetical protein
METKPDLCKGTHIDKIMNEIINRPVKLEIGEPSYSLARPRRSSEIAEVQKEQADAAGDASESENYKAGDPNISFAEMHKPLKQLEVFDLSESIEEAIGPEITVVAREPQAQLAQASISIAK